MAFFESKKYLCIDFCWFLATNILAFLDEGVRTFYYLTHIGDWIALVFYTILFLILPLILYFVYRKIKKETFNCIHWVFTSVTFNYHSNFRCLKTKTLFRVWYYHLKQGSKYLINSVAKFVNKQLHFAKKTLNGKKICMKGKFTA